MSVKGISKSKLYEMVCERVNANKYQSITGSFQSDAMKALGLEDHPKADKIYELAYRWGHAYGVSEVWIYLQDISELFEQD
jgi:hypothetical protein